MTRRQPATGIGGVYRPHVADLVTLEINDAHDLATADPDGPPGLRADDQGPSASPGDSHTRNLHPLARPIGNRSHTHWEAMTGQAERQSLSLMTAWPTG